MGNTGEDIIRRFQRLKTQDEIKKLIILSEEMLRSMQLPSLLFCFDRIKGQPHPRGSSLRYTLITLLGLLRAEKNGYNTSFNTRDIYNTVLLNIASKELTVGDLGLCLWVDSELEAKNHVKLMEMLNRRLGSHKGYKACVGMELAWIIIGALRTFETTGSTLASAIMNQSIRCFHENYVSPSGLFRHFGDRRFRARFPNFATQIYGILALSLVGKYSHDLQSLQIAQAAADRLLALQLPDGGWPWLYDTESGRILERYEIYSVHQDGMAPMSLFELSQAVDDPKYMLAALRGLDWIYGDNELSYNMIDKKESLIYRSIRHRTPFERMTQCLNTISAGLGMKSDLGVGHCIEINPTCRPYHLGWVLYAWCGKEKLVSLIQKNDIKTTDPTLNAEYAKVLNYMEN